MSKIDLLKSLLRGKAAEGYESITLTEFEALLNSIGVFRSQEVKDMKRAAGNLNLVKFEGGYVTINAGTQ